MKRIYESYPLGIVLLITTLLLSIYLSGIYIMINLHVVTGTLYIAYLLMLEFYCFREACTCCYYFGKLCAFGKGVIAKIFFERGEGHKFCKRELTFKDIIPQIIVVLLPLLVGIALLVSRGFDKSIFAAAVWPLASWLFLNPIIYGKLACPHCKQGTICCPALKFFSKKKK